MKTACGRCKHMIIFKHCQQGCKLEKDMVFDSILGMDVLIGYKWCNDKNRNGNCPDFKEKKSLFQCIKAFFIKEA